MHAAERKEEEAEAWMMETNLEFVAEQLVLVNETVSVFHCIEAALILEWQTVICALPYLPLTGVHWKVCNTSLEFTCNVFKQ